MEGLVVGSHDRDELILISSHGDLKEKPCEQGRICGICGICGDEVGVTEEGEVFVACNDCAFPICRACYEYERSDGAQVCPQCKTRFKRLKGCARVPGDDDEDGVDDLDHEFGFTSSDHATDLPQEQALVSTEFVDSTASEDSSSYGYGRMGWKKRLEKWKARQELLHRLKLENGDRDMDDGSDQDQDQDPPLMDEGRLPLSRKLPISTSQLNPYRMIIIIRFVVLGFFFHYRILHPVNDAYALWLVSVLCEIWFALSWILDQLPKWLPVNRETYLDRLSSRYEKEGQCCQLPSVDILVTTVDYSLKEPPLVTANTVLSILAVDYPVDKVSCYISDDGASILTFQALSETCEFARKWVPFCKKFSIEPRAPEWYFSEKMDYLKDKVFPEFIKERRAIKREYEEFKVAMNALVARAQKVPDEGWKMQDGTPWPGNNAKDHPGMIQVFIGQSGDHGKDLPCLMYVSREKRLGFDHHKKAGAMNALVRVSAVVTNAPYILNLDCDHYMNNSKTLREAMCFMMDPSTGKKVCYVQFPQMLDGTDAYATRNTVFFDINMKGLDGIQGPMYLGTGCVFRRVALYGYRAPKPKKSPGRTCSWWPHHRRNKKSPPKTTFPVEAEDEEGDEGLLSERSMMKLDHKLGDSPLFIASTLVEEEGGTTSPPTTPLLSEAIHVIGCGYEEKTDWGKEVGWIYGSTTEDMLTGFKMHCRGWRSIYCTPPRPAFKSREPSNLPNRMHQEMRRALGSVEIFFSKQCPMWCGYGRALKWLERFAYINATLYPFTSIPLLAYCTLPAVCLLTQKFITPEVNNVGGMLFISVFMCVFATCLLEMRWSGVGFGEWWRDEQAWVIAGVSARLFAVFQGLLKAAAGIDADLKWSITMLVPPTTVLILNLIGVVAGFSSAFSNGYESLGPLLGRLFFAFWVIAHLYPFLKGRLLGFRSRTPTIVVVWSILAASVFSFLWLRIDPFLPTLDGPALEECGLDCN